MESLSYAPVMRRLYHGGIICFPVQKAVDFTGNAGMAEWQGWVSCAMRSKIISVVRLAISRSGGMADTHDSKSCLARGEGSSPSSGTREETRSVSDWFSLARDKENQ